MRILVRNLIGEETMGNDMHEAARSQWRKDFMVPMGKGNCALVLADDGTWRLAFIDTWSYAGKRASAAFVAVFPDGTLMPCGTAPLNRGHAPKDLGHIEEFLELRASESALVGAVLSELKPGEAAASAGAFGELWAEGEGWMRHPLTKAKAVRALEEMSCGNPTPEMAKEAVGYALRENIETVESYWRGMDAKEVVAAEKLAIETRKPRPAIR